MISDSTTISSTNNSKVSLNNGEQSKQDDIVELMSNMITNVSNDTDDSIHEQSIAMSGHSQQQHEEDDDDDDIRQVNSQQVD